MCAFHCSWHRMLYNCNKQCDAQDAERRVIVAALVQPPFKFWSPAYRSGY